MNSLPVPGPSLAAATLPPCSSTSALTSVRPIPSPPASAAMRAVGLGEEFEDAGQLSGGMPTPVSRTAMTTSPPPRRP